MKRIASLILIAVLFVVFLVGCSNDHAGSSLVFASKEDFSGHDIACITGTVVDRAVDNVVDGLTWHITTTTRLEPSRPSKEGMWMPPLWTSQ